MTRPPLPTGTDLGSESSEACHPRRPAAARRSSGVTRGGGDVPNSVLNGFAYDDNTITVRRALVTEGRAVEAPGGSPAFSAGDTSAPSRRR